MEHQIEESWCDIYRRRNRITEQFYESIHASTNLMSPCSWMVSSPEAKIVYIHLPWPVDATLGVPRTHSSSHLLRRVWARQVKEYTGNDRQTQPDPKRLGRSIPLDVNFSLLPAASRTDFTAAHSGPYVIVLSAALSHAAQKKLSACSSLTQRRTHLQTDTFPRMVQRNGCTVDYDLF